MKTFKQFLEEARKIGPLKLMQRARRRFSKPGTDIEEIKDTRGNITRKKVNALMIPLNYDENVSNEIFNKIPLNPGKEVKKTFKIRSLHPTQDSVRVDNDDILKSKIETKTPNVRVATYKGKHYVVDGHHTVMGAMARGDTHIDAHHVDLDRIEAEKNN